MARASARQIEELLQYGILAASAHNTQPWLVLVEDDSDEFELRPDRSRQLIADESGRELIVSVGCFWGNVRRAALGLGVRVSASMIDEGVRISIEGRTGSADERKLNAIRSRRNNRFPLVEPFDPDVVKDVDSTGLEIHVLTDRDARSTVAGIVQEAFATHLRDRTFRVEFASWLRPNTSSARDGIPGYAVGFPTPVSYVMPFLVRMFSMSSMISKQERRLMESAPATIVVCGPDDLNGWLQAGRVFQELAVRLEENGYTCAVNASPVEVPPCAEELRQVLGTNSRPLVVFRAGRPTRQCRRVPRRPVTDIIRSKHDAGD